MNRKDKQFVCVALGIGWFLVCLIVAGILMGNT